MATTGICTSTKSFNSATSTVADAIITGKHPGDRPAKFSLIVKMHSRLGQFIDTVSGHLTPEERSSISYADDDGDGLELDADLKSFWIDSAK